MSVVAEELFEDVHEVAAVAVLAHLLNVGILARHALDQLL
jgi:hypothetical protein